MAEEGFHRHGNTWARQRNLFSDVIDLQWAKSRDRVTVNVGLMHVPTYEIVWGKSPTSPLSEAECTVRTRLGSLIDGRDRWWSLGDQTAAADIAGAIRSAAFPFLSGFWDLEDVERSLDASPTRYPPDALYSAAVKGQRGKVEEAHRLLREVLQRTTSEAWRERISAIAALLA